MNFIDKLREKDKKIFLAALIAIVLIIAIIICVCCLSCSENPSYDNSTNDTSATDESSSKDISTENTLDETKNDVETESSTDQTESISNETESTSDDGSTSSTKAEVTEETTTSKVEEPTTNKVEENVVNTSDGIIHLNGNSISYDGTGATIKGSEVTITAAGEYSVIGTLNDGRIIVNAPDDADVKINLLGVDISNSSSCGIYVISADKVTLKLAENTTNTINDSSNYTYDDVTNEEPNAAIFSKDDLVIKGEGKLVVNGNFNNGIASKDDLRIKGGTIVVNAVNNGLKGKDAIELENASVTVISGGDAMKSDNEEEGMGGIYIESGTYTLTAKEDGMQAETEIIINGGTFNIKTGNGSNSSGANSDTSMKGIKATGNITINDGTFTINSQDDSIHANTNVIIAGGTLNMSSADDGLHADTDLTISGGNVTITKSYEGIEATNIYIKGGTTSVVASDDGLNAAGGIDSSSSTTPGGNNRPGMGNFSNSTGTITFSGGTLTVDSSGDGIDSNGTVTYTSGNVTVYGPTSGGNGTLDYDGSWTQNGGNFVGLGTKDMAQMPSGGTQYSVMVTFTSSYQAGSIVTVEDSSGKEVLNVTAKKTFQNLVFSNANLSTGSYTIKINGQTYTTFTISSLLTTIGNSSNRPGR